ncbi:unnamed protein product [Adineta ricciae]|uniref:Mitochondrial inner membrane protease ATP23 n=1 Tax=Adineta ricciae TaxID=249248 RepID=A0A814S3M1_ADIRI|nr:unnamed protein product [Adineta ricciae]
MSDATSSKFSNCYQQARQCVTSNQSIRQLLNVLSTYGCPFDFDRHLTCETTDRNLRGGFHQSLCQIVLYPENIQSTDELCTIFEHELVHALDYCRAEIDFANPYHLACTEIRAASLTDQCSLLQHLSTSSRPFRITNQHESCVKNRAQQSMEMCTDLPRKQVDQIINDVFLRCYNDTEPFDRIRRRQ